MKASDNPFPSILVEEATEPSAPAAGHQRLYIDSSSHKLKRTDSSGTDVDIESAGGDITTDAAWTAKGDLIVGTGDDTASILSVGTNDYVLTADSAEATGLKWAAAGGSASADDPIADKYGTPATAYEFATSSLTGLTAVGTPDYEDADTTVPDNYFLMDNAASTAWCGRYFASPSDGSTAFTAITKLTDFNNYTNYQAAGVFIAEATPGKMSSIHSSRNRDIYHEMFTNPTTYSSSAGNFAAGLSYPAYLAIRVNSATNVDFLWSRNGRIWRKLVSANNPGYTIGAVGIAMKSETANGCAAAFDFIRVWTSALTFPGT